MKNLFTYLIILGINFLVYAFFNDWSFKGLTPFQLTVFCILTSIESKCFEIRNFFTKGIIQEEIVITEKEDEEC